MGYDRDEVDAELAAREARIVSLQTELSELEERVTERERRLSAALGRLGEGGEGIGGEPDPQTLTERLEEIYAQARRQATRIRLKALGDAVQMADRVFELTKVRDGLLEVFDDSGLSLEPHPAELGAEAGGPVDAAPRQLFEGGVEVEVGPLADFAQLSGFEDAANEIGAADEISVKRFSGGRATIAIELAEPVDLLRELEERAPLEFRVRSRAQDRLVLDVDADDEAAAA